MTIENEELLREVSGNLVALLAEIKSLKVMQKKWLTIKEAADYLGFSIGTMHNKVHNREIPYYGKRRSRRFKQDDLDRMLERQKVKKLDIKP